MMGTKAEQFLRENTEFLRGNIKYACQSFMFQECAEIILCNFDLFRSPFTNLIIETNWDEEILPQILWDFSGGINRTQTQLKSCSIKIFLCWIK